MLLVKIGTGLLLVSLALLIIYGTDVIVAMSKNGQDGTKSPRGFLPLNDATRGIAFGVTAVVMSVVAFIITRKAPSRNVVILLIVNGGVILTGMFFLYDSGYPNCKFRQNHRINNPNGHTSSRPGSSKIIL